VISSLAVVSTVSVMRSTAAGWLSMVMTCLDVVWVTVTTTVSIMVSVMMTVDIAVTDSWRLFTSVTDSVLHTLPMCDIVVQTLVSPVWLVVVVSVKWLNSTAVHRTTSVSVLYNVRLRPVTVRLSSIIVWLDQFLHTTQPTNLQLLFSRQWPTQHKEHTHLHNNNNWKLQRYWTGL